MSESIGQVLNKRKAAGQKALVAYVTAGDPSIAFTKEIIIELEKTGVDIIELGVPFVVPVGDGPVIQKSVQRALENQVTLADILKLTKELREEGARIPIVLFSYHNPIFNFGYQSLADAAGRSGVSGALIVDFPPEEAGEYRAIMNKAGIDTIFLATPVTGEHRLDRINEFTSGFCYYVSRAGTTGNDQALSQTLVSEVARVKKHITVPVLIGFGIRTPEQAHTVGQIADGVIVGSAFVELVEQSSSVEQARTAMIELALRLRNALDAA